VTEKGRGNNGPFRFLVAGQLGLQAGYRAYGMVGGFAWLCRRLHLPWLTNRQS
jgi:hypothetical protein